MQESHVEVIGNLTADPVTKVIGPKDTAVTNFRLASTPRWRDKDTGAWRDGETSFYNVSTWRWLAENVAASLHKGDRVVVIGRLRQRTYLTADAVERTSLDIDADLVGPDLNRHVAAVRKVDRPASAPGEITAPAA